MGLFSKVWKGLKKTVKKIGKGIKKVFKKVGAAIGKLGIVGQIGMMFLMPYAAGALGSFFGATGKLATWSTNLLSKAGMGSKALGHTLNLINKAGTFVGNAYNTVSQTIGNAIDRTGNFLKGRGFELSEGRTSIFAKDKLSVAETTPKVDVKLDTSDIKIGDDNFNLFDKDGKLIVNKTDTSKITGELLDLGTKDYDNILKLDPNTIKVDTSEIVEGIRNIKTDSLLEPKPNMIDNILEKGQDFLEDELKGGARKLVKQEVYKGFGVEQSTGDYNSYTFNLPGVVDRGLTNNSVYGEIDFALQKTGNNYLASNIQNSNYLNSLIDNTDSYKQHMSSFSGGMYSFG
jgi:hypothetical protein